MDENTFNPEVPGQEPTPEQTPTVNVETTPVVEPTDMPQEIGVSQAATEEVAQVATEPTMEANTSDKATKILKVAVPIIVALVVVVGGYFAYATFFGGSDTPAIDQSVTDNIPNFLENAASQEQIPSDYEDALQDITTEPATTDTEVTTPAVETPAVETPVPETPKVKVPRT